MIVKREIIKILKDGDDILNIDAIVSAMQEAYARGYRDAGVAEYGAGYKDGQASVKGDPDDAVEELLP